MGVLPCLANLIPQLFMMISHAPTFFVLFFLFHHSLAFPGFHRQQVREICYDTDVLLSFQAYKDDSVPYCSSLLGISDTTIFVGPTKSYTYVLLYSDRRKH